MATNSNVPANTARGLYINTMVFGIIAGVVSLILLLFLLFIQGSRSFIYSIVVVELGLIAIIIYSIVAIYQYEATVKKLADQGSKFIVAVDTCPDYFTNRFVELAPGAATTGPGARKPGVVCSNGFQTSDNSKKYYFVKRGCTGTSLTDQSCMIDTATSNSNLNVALQDYNMVTAADICNRVNTQSADAMFSNIPWTDVKSRCNSLSIGSV